MEIFWWFLEESDSSIAVLSDLPSSVGHYFVFPKNPSILKPHQMKPDQRLDFDFLVHEGALTKLNRILLEDPQKIMQFYESCYQSPREERQARRLLGVMSSYNNDPLLFNQKIRDYGIYENHGPYAGQSVDHYHTHVVPRFVHQRDMGGIGGMAFNGLHLPLDFP